LGWLLRALASFYVTARHLRLPAAALSEASAAPLDPAG
jgi:hypothetical protein